MLDSIAAPLLSGSFFIDFLRLATLLVAVFNLTWAAPGIWNLFRAKNWPLPAFRTGVALFSLGAIEIQTMILLGGASTIDSAGSVAGLLALLGAHTCFCYVHLSGLEDRVRQFWAVYPKIDKAIAIVDLHNLNPERAERLHTETVAAVADEIVKARTGLTETTQGANHA